jgi:ATP synthase protein I
MTKSGNSPPDDRLKDLDKKLDDAIASRNNKDDLDTTDSKAAGFAMRAITEILVALAVCTIGGYYLDRYFGTTPWLMIILMPLGQAAGVWNVMRMSRSKAAEEIMGVKGPMPPSVKDDDED